MMPFADAVEIGDIASIGLEQACSQRISERFCRLLPTHTGEQEIVIFQKRFAAIGAFESIKGSKR